MFGKNIADLFREGLTNPELGKRAYDRLLRSNVFIIQKKNDTGTIDMAFSLSVGTEDPTAGHFIFTSKRELDKFMQVYPFKDFGCEIAQNTGLEILRELKDSPLTVFINGEFLIPPSLKAKLLGLEVDCLTIAHSHIASVKGLYKEELPSFILTKVLPYLETMNQLRNSYFGVVSPPPYGSQSEHLEIVIIVEDLESEDAIALQKGLSEIIKHNKPPNWDIYYKLTGPNDTQNKLFIEQGISGEEYDLQR